MWWVSVILVLVILFLPRALVLLCSRVKLFGMLGPVFLCLACGILIGLPLNALAVDTSIAAAFVNYTIPIAIPLILFSADYSPLKRMAGRTLLSFVLVVASVIVVSCCCYFVFRNRLPNMAGLSGMMVGLYTGGTPNLYAIGRALAVPGEQITLAVAADTVVGGIYFAMLLSFMPELVRRLLPAPPAVQAASAAPASEEEQARLTGEFVPEKKAFSVRYLLRRVPVILLAAACFAVSAGAAWLITGDLDNQWVVVVVMLGVTTLGIALSFIKRVRNAPGSYSAGQYFIYMFSVAMGIALNLSSITLSMLLFLAVFAFAQFGAVVLHLLLCRLCRIDAHTAIITSTAGVYGPAFVAPVANALGDKTVVLPGLLCGILGYAAGNYLGVLVGSLLALF